MKGSGKLIWQAELVVLDIAASHYLADSLERLVEDISSLQEAACKASDQLAMWLIADAQALLTLKMAQPIDEKIGQLILFSGTSDSTNKEQLANISDVPVTVWCPCHCMLPVLQALEGMLPEMASYLRGPRRGTRDRERQGFFNGLGQTPAHDASSVFKLAGSF